LQESKDGDDYLTVGVDEYKGDTFAGFGDLTIVPKDDGTQNLDVQLGKWARVVNTGKSNAYLRVRADVTLTYGDDVEIVDTDVLDAVYAILNKNGQANDFSFTADASDPLSGYFYYVEDPSDPASALKSFEPGVSNAAKVIDGSIIVIEEGSNNDVANALGNLKLEITLYAEAVQIESNGSYDGINNVGCSYWADAFASLSY
jgi:hypothetical protein